MKKILSIVGIFVCAQIVLAQNTSLNQTVQVVNSFENKLTGMERRMDKLPVPDSLYHFDLNFDYSGFDTPYKGNSEFNPFFTELEMSGRPFDGRKFYMKAGAGYNFAPVLDLYATFKDKGCFKVGTHVEADGFYGLMRGVSALDGELLPRTDMDWAGYDAKARAGFDARADWAATSLMLLLDYEGSLGKSSPGTQYDYSFYNGANFQMNLDSHYNPKTRWKVLFDLGYAFGYQYITPSDIKLGNSTATEHNPRLRLFLRKEFGKGSAFDIDLSGSFTMNSHAMGYTAIATPRYFFNSRKVYLGIGAAVLFDGGNMFAPDQKKPLPLMIWPALEFQWAAVKDRLDIYAFSEMTGRMYGIREDALNNRMYVPYMMDNMRFMTAQAGFRGCLGRKFNYDVYGGFKAVANDHLFRVTSGEYPYAIGLDQVSVNTSRVFAGTKFDGTFGGFNMKGSVTYDFYFRQDAMISVPSALNASLDMKYTILRRISFGAGAEYRSPYKAGAYKTPYILDLRALAEYKVNSPLVIFLNGSNLLNRSHQLVPMYARKGVCITGGVVLTL